MEVDESGFLDEGRGMFTESKLNLNSNLCMRVEEIKISSTLMSSAPALSSVSLWKLKKIEWIEVGKYSGKYEG